MPVLDHLRELRRRVIIVVIFVALGAVIGWYLYNPTIAFLKHPYCSIDYRHRFPGNDPTHCDLIYTNVLDGFTTRLKVALISGAVFTGPLWLYQIWAFITPGLRSKERKYTIIFIVASTVLFALGMGLAYVVLAKGLSVIIGISGTGIQSLLTVNAYLSFVTLMMVIFGAAFELPLLVVMANLAGVLSAKLLIKSQRIAIFMIFLFAAVATPSTDPFTMCAMAVPMVILFEGAVVLAVFHDRRKARRKDAERSQEHLDDDVPSTVEPMPEAISDTTWADTT
ncbi:MAG: sec-independent protein translocase protein TatC [Pseudonocardiales bacterium]|jgi:sec-independent protein translocase protein TatC|nr:sec-independent protein translocase protein TatC [Pseudonocardiales bacterium]